MLRVMTMIAALSLASPAFAHLGEAAVSKADRAAHTQLSQPQSDQRLIDGAVVRMSMPTCLLPILWTASVPQKDETALAVAQACLAK